MIIMELPENKPTKRDDAEFTIALKKTTVSHLENTVEKIESLEIALDHLRETKWDLVDTLIEMRHDFKSTPEVLSEIEESGYLYLEIKVEDLFDRLSVRAVNGLKKIIGWHKVGTDKKPVETVKDLVQMSWQDVLKYKNLGRKSANEIRVLLSEMGLTFSTKF